MNLLRIIQNIKGLFKRIDYLSEEEVEKLVEYLDEQNIPFKIFEFEDQDLSKGIQIYGDKINSRDFQNIINNIRNKI